MPQYTVELYSSTNITYTVNAASEEAAEDIATGMAFQDGYDNIEVETVTCSAPYKFYNQNLNSADQETENTETYLGNGVNSYQPYNGTQTDSENLDTNVISISPPGDSTVH